MDATAGRYGGSNDTARMNHDGAMQPH